LILTLSQGNSFLATLGCNDAIPLGLIDERVPKTCRQPGLSGPLQAGIARPSADTAPHRMNDYSRFSKAELIERLRTFEATEAQRTRPTRAPSKAPCKKVKRA